MKKKLNLLTLSKEEERKIQGGMPCGGYCSHTTCRKAALKHDGNLLADSQAELANNR